jgi:hypothetical protein
MPAQRGFGDNSEDSLDRVERLMAAGEALIGRIRADESLSLDQREYLIREIEARVNSGEFWNEDGWDDDALGILVRTLGPKGPRGKSGEAVHAETEWPDSFRGAEP